MSAQDKPTEANLSAAATHTNEEAPGTSGVVMTRGQAERLKFYDPTVPSPFDGLPNEVIELLFRYLDRRSLKSSALVNKKWRDIIGSSVVIMKKLPLIVNLSRRAAIVGLKKLERKYQIANFVGADGNLPTHISNALKRICGNVKSIKYSNGSCSVFFDVMRCLGNIEKAAVFSVSFSEVDEDFEAPVMSKLRTLEAQYCTNFVFPEIQLVKLVLAADFLSVTSFWKSFAHFLSTQTRLEELDIESLLHVVIPNDVIFQPLKCQVRRLRFGGLLRGEPKDVEFMKIFAPSVETLNLFHMYLSANFMLNVLKDYKSLLILKVSYISIEGVWSINAVEEEKNNVLVEEKEFDVSVMILHVSYMNFDILSFRRFFSMFRSTVQLNLEEFSCRDNTTTINDVIIATRNMKNIEKMVVLGPIDLFRSSSFDNLNTLIWNRFNATANINWTEFIDNNPKLVNVTINVQGGRLNCEALVKGARDQMIFKIHGTFSLTKQRLKAIMRKDFPEIILHVHKFALIMSQEEFEEIVKDSKSVVKFH